MNYLSLIKKPYIGAAAVYIAVSVVFGVQILDLKLHAMLVPTTCILIISLCVVVSLLGKEKTPELSTNRKEIVTLLAIAVYVGAIYVVGFYIASGIFTVFMFLQLSKFKGINIVLGIVYAFALGAIIYGGFEVGLEYFIPKGLIFE